MNPPQKAPAENLQQRAIRLIEPLIPQDAVRKVRDVVQQFNALVREHIRTETGLRLADDTGRSNVPVRVVCGFPEEVAQWLVGNPDHALWRLFLTLPKLDNVVDGLGLIVNNWGEFENWEALSSEAKGKQQELETSLAVAKALREALSKKKTSD